MNNIIEYYPVHKNSKGLKGRDRGTSPASAITGVLPDFEVLVAFKLTTPVPLRFEFCLFTFIDVLSTCEFEVEESSTT